MKKYFGTIEEIRRYFYPKYNGKKVLEIGPGKIPFPFATHFVDHNQEGERFYKVDIDTEPLPFEDKEFDFVYCRHVLEDIQNPDFAFKEICRVAKNGYIETPSPLVETKRGVNGNFCGYVHHRYFVWVDNGTLSFLAKYPIMEYNEIDEGPFDYMIKHPIGWNTYYYWEEGDEPKCKMYKHEKDFEFTKMHTYTSICNKAIEDNIENTRKIIEKFQLPVDLDELKDGKVYPLYQVP